MIVMRCSAASLCSSAALLLAASALVPVFIPLAPVHAEVQLSCQGTLLEARGHAEQDRPVRSIAFSLGLQANGTTADAALGSLQSRLGDVRDGLRRLGVEDLRVSSPSTWQRPVEAGRRSEVEASLQVSGRLEPRQLQPLIRSVGSLPGVRLSPVRTDADAAMDASVRGQLLRRAYRDALAQAREVAEVLGRRRLDPLEVQVDAGELRPVAMRAMEAMPAPPFDPRELERPVARLNVFVRFCAQ